MLVSQQRLLQSGLRGSFGRTNCRQFADGLSTTNRECKVAMVTFIQRFDQLVTAASEGRSNLPMGDAGPPGDVNCSADQMVTVRYATDCPVVSRTPVSAGYPTILFQHSDERWSSDADTPIRRWHGTALSSLLAHRR